tara:strand:- start:222 stop:710 length:489 start_codon:yes stop_codon:yes gene_type:complete
MKNTMQNIINACLAIIVTLLIYNVFELKEKVDNLDQVSNSSAIDVVKSAYETFGNGDMEGWKKLHSEDLTFTVLGNIATTGVHVGPDNVIKDVFNVIPGTWPNFSIVHKEIYSDGDNVFVHSDMTADNLKTETMHMFKVKNGIITSFIAFDDTGSMADAAKK